MNHWFYAHEFTQCKVVKFNFLVSIPLDARQKVISRTGNDIGGDESSTAQREGRDSGSHEGYDGQSPANIMHLERVRVRIRGESRTARVKWNQMILIFLRLQRDLR